MHKPISKSLAFAVALTAVFATASLMAAEKPPAALDAGLYTEFDEVTHNLIDFNVCGSLPSSHGCYGGGEMNPPFDYACAILQGEPSTKGNVMKRDIYVLDKRTSSTDPVQLYVYQRKDQITDTYDTVTLTYVVTINLGITGGSKSHCSMAADQHSIFAGTDASTSAVKIDKSNFSTYLFGDTDNSVVTGVSADDRGYICVQFSAGCLVEYKGYTVEEGTGVFVGTSNSYKIP